jgi:hypothetical protein
VPAAAEDLSAGTRQRGEPQEQGRAAGDAVGSQALNKLGIQLGSSGNAQQAVQKGALAATSPQMQGAIMIQLLSANTHLQEMIWRGCKPSSG